MYIKLQITKKLVPVLQMNGSDSFWWAYLIHRADERSPRTLGNYTEEGTLSVCMMKPEKDDDEAKRKNAHFTLLP